MVSLLIAIPLIAAALIVLCPHKLARWLALAGSFVTLITSFVITLRFLEFSKSAGDDVAQLALKEQFSWFESFGIEYLVGVDGISVFMVVLTAIIIFTGVLASWKLTKRVKEFFVFLMILVAGVFGVFVSFDLFLFFVFYEVAVLPMYLLIGIWGTGKKEYSAMKLTLMLLASSALILVGILAIYHVADLRTFNLFELASISYPLSFQDWVFPCLFLGFGVLGALYPFHTWSPDGHASAPTAVSMLHAGVLMKLGGYGILRIAVFLLPEGAKSWALFFMVLTTINILYGAFGAIRQKDLKYFTAYSSVSHCGFVLFGICSLNLIGFKGAVLQMFSHGIMTGLFFALIGMVYERTKTRSIPDMGGLAKVMPWLATCFYIAGLASLGLPGLAGFVAESHVFLGGFFYGDGSSSLSDFVTARVLTILATCSIVVTAVYVLRGLASVFQGPLSNPDFTFITDATLSEKFATGILVATLFVVGLLPWFFIDLIEGSIVPIVNKFENLQGGVGF